MVDIKKANGEIEPFSEEKVIASIKRAKIPTHLQSEVLTHIEKRLRPHMTTQEIYHHITEFLGASDEPYTKSTYSLKQALMDLGPTGHPFEDYVARIFEADGYQTQSRLILMGSCISHEVDVIAKKDHASIMVEAKFHNRIGTRSDVHVPMYTKSRFDDLKVKHSLTESWVVTNTKATLDAITFAQCVGMRILSWSYPEEGSLQDLIEKYKLYPITMLSTLSTIQKTSLLDQQVVLCEDLIKNHKYLTMLSLSNEGKNKVLDELAFIIK